MDRSLNPELIGLALGEHGILPSPERVAELLTQAELALLVQRPRLSDDLVAAGWYLHAIASSKYALRTYGIERQRAAYRVSAHIFDLLLQTPDLSRLDRLKYCFAAQVAYLGSELDPNAIAIQRRDAGIDLADLGLLTHFPEVAVSCGVALLGMDVGYLFGVTDHIKSEVRGLESQWDVDSIYSTPFGAAAGAALATRGLLTFLMYGRTEARANAVELLRRAIAAEPASDDQLSRWVAAHLLNLADSFKNASVWTQLPPEIPPTVKRAFTLGHPKILTLWPPQLAMFKKSPNPLSPDAKRLLISTPTSGGKTLLAQLLVVSHMATSPGSVCYVAPTRSLCREVRKSLESRLRFLGGDILDGLPDDGWPLEPLGPLPRVEVMTPERLAFLIRANGPQVIEQFGMFIFDEVHLIGESGRGWTLEQNLAYLHYFTRSQSHRIILISAAIGNRNHFVQWLNEDGSETVQLHSDWRGPRRLHALWTTEPDWDSPEVPQLPLSPEFPYQAKYPLYGRLDALISHSGQVSAVRTLDPIGELWVTVSPDGSKERDSEQSTPFYIMLVPMIRHLAQAGPILVVEGTRRDAVRMAQAIAQDEAPANPTSIGPLLDLVQARLGQDHPLSHVLQKGVAYHHGSLPGEVRSAIEEAVSQGLLRILVATTTMTEGVNTPVRSVVIATQGGYSPEGYIEYIRGPKLVNAVGRAGRATKETEGIVVLARQARPASTDFQRLAPEDSDTQVISMLAREDALRDLAMFEELRRSGEDAVLEMAEGEVADFLSFVWFIAAALEEIGESPDEEHLAEALGHTLGWVQLDPHDRDRWLAAASQVLGRYASAPPQTRRRLATSRGSLKSVSILERIALSLKEEIIQSGLPQDLDAAIGLLCQNNRLEQILSLPEAPKRKFYKHRAGGNRAVVTIPIDEFLIDWLKGTELLTLAQKYFGVVPDTEFRFEQLGDFISEYLETFFPWAFGTIITWTNHSLAEVGMESALLRSIPLSIRWGVGDPTALELLARGIQSRRLAMAVAQRWHNEGSGAPDVRSWLQSMSTAQWRQRFSAAIPELRNLLDFVRDQKSGPGVELVAHGQTVIQVDALIDNMPESTVNLVQNAGTEPAPIEVRVEEKIVAHIRSRDQADIQSLLDSKVALHALFSASLRIGTLRLNLVDPE